MKLSLRAILILSILEISWGNIRSNTFTKIPSSKISGTIIASYTVRTRVRCSSICLVFSECEAFNWALSTIIDNNNCQLVKYPDSVTVTSDSAYDCYIDPGGFNLRTNIPGYWGSWGDDLKCPIGSFVYGYSVWYDTYTGDLFGEDDCGMTGVEILCRTPSGDDTGSHVFKQSVGAAVKKPEAKCAGTNFVKGFKTRMGTKMSSKDDDGMTNLRLRCQNDVTIVSLEDHNRQQISSAMTYCPTGTLMCGLRPRYKAWGTGDNTCFNDVLIYCCANP